MTAQQTVDSVVISCMKTCKKCGVEKMLDEFYMRVDGHRGECKTCWRAKSKKRYEENPEQHAASVAKWRKENAEKDRQVRRRATSKWFKANPAHVNERNARRHASKKRATPAWADPAAILALYELAQVRTRETGVQWEVDHVVPLNNPLVQGLHCEHNLQVIPALDNVVKGNRHWPDMP